MYPMSRILLLGAGFSRNWGAPLANEITGSLLGDLHDDAVLAQRLRSGPFEDAFAGFETPRGDAESAKRLLRLQGAVTALFDRMNAALAATPFEFKNEVPYTIKGFLERFDAIFTLNQDLLLETHYLHRVLSPPRWSGATAPGMQSTYDGGHPGLADPTKLTWRPSGPVVVPTNIQPYYKLHGSSNWKDEGGDPVLIMGSAKSGAIERFPILRAYHDAFRAISNEPASRLMVIGYSFQDEHINQVICNASANSGLGTFLVDPLGRDVLKDPKMVDAMIKPKRDVEDIKIIGELKRSLSEIFRPEAFAHGELMRFFA
jgi:hypothetical protein